MFVYFVFGILIIVFILSFGPQSGQIGGCGGTVNTAARVSGGEISEASFRYGILASGGGSASGERARRSLRRERVLDSLIVRELLAQSAEQMGFRVSDKEVREKVVGGEIYILGERLDGKRIYFIQGEGDDAPHFAARGLDAFAKNLGLGSVERFMEEERREILAQKVRDLISSSVRVSPEEVQHQYQMDASKVEIEYVAFQPATYRAGIDVTPAEIDAYLAEHEADLKAQYDKEADRWKGRDKEVRVRHLFVKTERPPAPVDDKGGDDKGGDDKGGDKPAGKPPANAKPDPARAKAAAALAKIKAGQDFAAVAKTVDPDLKRGGDLGWRPLRGLRLGEEVANAVAKLEKGQVTDVIEAPDGYHIVQLIDAREGDLAFEAIKKDLAETALLDEKSKAAAKADAEKALAAAKAGTPLEKQFPAEAEGGEPPAAPGAKPRLQKGTDINRVGGYLPGIGTSKELVAALFDKITVGETADQVYEVAGDFFVVRLTKREEPDMTKFQEERPRLAAEMARAKSYAVLSSYQARRCHEAAERGAISYDPTLVTYNDIEGAGKPTYAPCQTLR